MKKRFFTTVDYVTGVLVHDCIEMLQKISYYFVQNNVDTVKPFLNSSNWCETSSSNSMIHMCK